MGTFSAKICCIYICKISWYKYHHNLAYSKIPKPITKKKKAWKGRKLNLKKKKYKQRMQNFISILFFGVIF